MAAYYNEIDRHKAEWLRELMRANLIAPGDVDERSIKDVRPDDLRGYTQCHFFAGIGIWSYALRLAGWPDDREVWTGSCPCQPFSAAGQGGGFNDPRHLWPDWYQLIAERSPVVVFGEQVAAKPGLAWLDLVQTDMEKAHYAIGTVDFCAASVGAPHIRQRLYWVGAADSDAGGHNRGRASEGCPTDEEGQRGSRVASEEHIDTGRVADAAVFRHDGRRSGEALGRQVEPERLRDAGRMDDPAGARCVRAVPTPEGNPRDEARLRVPGERGPVNGFWRNADWVLTRPQRVGDRPGLRPVKPGAFPLASGFTGRVPLLRGAGDGIVAEQAAAFIRAYLDATAALSDSSDARSSSSRS